MQVPGAFDLIGQKRTRKVFRALSVPNIQFPREQGNCTHVSRLHVSVNILVMIFMLVFV